MYLSFLAIGIIIFETYLEFKKGRTALSIIEDPFTLKYCFGTSPSNLDPIPAAGIIATMLSSFI